MLIDLAERGVVPDVVVRAGIRQLLRQRLRTERVNEPEVLLSRKANLLAELANGPVALAQQDANAQHYEVPAQFYELVLGPHLKYSSGLWRREVRTLAQAEEAMLELTCRRADLRDGQRILELGCGWGSLSLWMARNYPRSSITAVSNSASQKSFIEARARERRLHNLQVVTADVAEFEPWGSFDRVVSVEMFEHMRNHGELMRRVHRWLAPMGKLFVHIFCHRDALYLFEDRGSGDWMARMFFTGGVMPSFDLLERADHPLRLEQRWQVNGMHYSRSLEAWLDNLDARREEILALIGPMPDIAPERWLERWRLFFMACSELFRYHDGEEWFVGHYLFRRE